MLKSREQMEQAGTNLEEMAAVRCPGKARHLSLVMGSTS